ncbi:hypothetical protein [uncultured Coprobacter sp.]|uniref:hypothetical protein n=1 Tax=uncultured Coprobacter sp. TaxID=1720550 RepID=UPI00260316B5|nr:hypothetical protein [uncultured Coprobacter sp.]
MKTKQEQIEELVYIVKEAIRRNGTYWVHFDYIEMDNNDVDHAAEESAKELYSAGYRKQSDTVREFVGKVLKIGSKRPLCVFNEYGEGYIDCIENIKKIAKDYGVEVKK